MLLEVYRLDNLELLSVLDAIFTACDQHHRLQMAISRLGIKNVKTNLIAFKVSVVIVLYLESDYRSSLVEHVGQDRNGGRRSIAQLADAEPVRVLVVAEVHRIIRTALHVATASILLLIQKVDRLSIEQKTLDLVSFCLELHDDTHVGLTGDLVLILHQNRFFDLSRLV